MVQSGGRVVTGEPSDPVLGGPADHDAIRDGVGCELERTLDIARSERCVDRRDLVGIDAVPPAAATSSSQASLW
jgi:hypothetical protein